MGWPNIDISGGSSIPCPKHVLIPFIDNVEVVGILELVFKKTQGLWDEMMNAPVVKPVPGVRFDAGSEAGMAILGTKHGAAVSFLLLQHKREFGVRAVKEVRVWHEVEGGDVGWYLYFGIGDVGTDVIGPGDVGKGMRARL